MLDKKDLLVRSLLTLETEDQCKDLVKDLFTTKEIDDFTNRLYIAAALDAGRTFVDIEEEVRASSATISRVNRCLKNGKGYRYVIDRLKEEV